MSALWAGGFIRVVRIAAVDRRGLSTRRPEKVVGLAQRCSVQVLLDRQTERGWQRFRYPMLQEQRRREQIQTEVPRRISTSWHADTELTPSKLTLEE